MPSIDIISQICVYNDYPIFRQLLTKYREKFNKIIFYPSRHHGVIDQEDFLRRTFPETWVTGDVIDWATPGIDWRQRETEPCLELSESEWILFMEQDFFVEDWDIFWSEIEEVMKTTDAIGWWNKTAYPYLHPCFLLIKRSILDKTNKDFRAHPEIEGCDHFAMITRDLEAIGAKIVKLQELGYVEWDNAFHMGGLTYPYQNWKGDGTDHFGVASPEAFMVYNYFSRLAPVEQSPEYLKLSLEIEDRLRELFPVIKLEDNRWVKFFKL